MDLICYQDGVLLFLEVKLGDISSAHEVWLHRTNTLRKASRQLRLKQVVLSALIGDQDLRARLGYHGQNPEADLRA